MNRYYEETRGCIRDPQPLTEAYVQKVTAGEKQLDEIAQVLAAYGLSVDKVICAPGRIYANIFYADFVQGAYMQLDLALDGLNECGVSGLQQLRAVEQSGCRALRKENWLDFYKWDVPNPLLMLDFQYRYMKIEPSFVFEVWMSIYKRIEYQNGAWKPEIIAYVFSHAPVPDLSQVAHDGQVFVYRGVGERSTPQDKALSWTTDPGNALWFANHHGRGTQLLTGQVGTGDVVAYFPGFWNENEILVWPGTVTNICPEDMIVSSRTNLDRLFGPVSLDFLQYGIQARKFGYAETQESIFNVHTIRHILRVLLLSLIYIHHSGEELAEGDKNILVYFSLLHDCARETDEVEERHGAAAVSLIKKKGLRVGGLSLSKKEYLMADLIIACHCLSDDEGKSFIDTIPSLTQKDKARTMHLFDIAKDMDGLDRVRFNGLDYRQLRTSYAKKLPLIAGGLLQEDLLGLLDALQKPGWE